MKERYVTLEKIGGNRSSEGETVDLEEKYAIKASISPSATLNPD